MTLAEFKKLNKKYRMVCDWDDELKNCNKDSFFIPCWNNNGMICWKDNKTMEIIMFSSPTNILEKLNSKYGIKLESFGELGEYTVKIDRGVDYEKVFECFKAKAQAKQPIPPHSNRNITLFLRVMQNIHPRYKKQLEGYIEQHRKE